jgi:hypothetical protein
VFLTVVSNAPDVDMSFAKIWSRSLPTVRLPILAADPGGNLMYLPVASLAIAALPLVVQSAVPALR